MTTHQELIESIDSAIDRVELLEDVAETESEVKSFHRVLELSDGTLVRMTWAGGFWMVDNDTLEGGA